MDKVKQLTDRDLLNNNYCMKVLEKNINNFNKKIVLYSQNLDAEFCVKYILDMDIDNGSEDSYLFDKCYILNKQKHITEKEFDEAFIKYYIII